MLTLFSTIISFGYTVCLIYGHLTHFSKPNEQKQIIRILILVPFFGIISFCCLVALYSKSTSTELYLNAIIDLYESYAIYAFMMLMFAYLEADDEKGSRALMLKFEGTYVKWELPLCCVNDAHIDASFFRKVKVMIVQFLILNPFMTILS